MNTMRKMKPKFQAFLICCLICLFAFSATGQKLTGNTVFVESKKDDKVGITQQTNSSSSTFVPTKQPATDVQKKQVTISGNNQQLAAPVPGTSSTKVSYDFPSISASEAQINQVKAVDSEEHVTASPNNNLPESAVCSSAVDYSDVNVCSTSLPVGVSINSCDFIPEQLGPDDMITFSGVEIYQVVNGTVSTIPLLTTFQSQTLGSTVCTAPAFTLPSNTTCDVIEYNFVAFTYIYTGTVIDGGVEITSKTLDTECENASNIDSAMDEFTIFVYPVLSLEIVEVDPSPVDNCGIVEAQLETQSGEACTEAISVSCTTNGEILSFEFDYPFEGVGCPTTQFMSVTSPCAGCPCAAEADFEDAVACSSTDAVSANIISCNIDAPTTNPDGTILVPALEIYEAGAVAPVVTLFQCDPFTATFPANEGCAPVVYSYTVLSVIQTQDADGTVISSAADDCEETFTVTILPELTAGVVEDQTNTASCGTLTVALFDATGALCEGSEVTGMCPMTNEDDNGGMVTIVVDNPYPDCGEASFTLTSGPCLGCDCGGIVTYESPAPTCSSGTDNISLTISIADTDADGNPDCSVTPEIDNGDGTLTIVGFDFFDAGGTYLGTLLESSTLGTSACQGVDITFLANQTCEAQSYDFTVVTSINTLDLATGAIDGINDPLCAAPATFSVTINPTLSVQLIDDSSIACGAITAALVAEDGTVCTTTQMTSGTCENNDDDLSVLLTDAFGCVTDDLTVSAVCSGCFVPTVDSEGCDCFPDGIDNDGDGINELAIVEIIIQDNPGQTGVDWTLDSSGGLLNPDGTPTTAMVMDNGDGTYTLTAYVAADNSTYTAVFTNTIGDDPLVFNSQPCLPCPPPLDEVPTVGEWGLIILGLLMMITAIVGIRARREEETYA